MTDGAQDPNETQTAPDPAGPLPKTDAHSVRRYPGFSQAIILIVALVTLQLLLTVPFVFVGMYRHLTALVLPTLIGIAVAIVYGYSRNSSRTGLKFKQLFPVGAISSPVLLSLLLTAAGLFIVNLAIAGWVTRILPPPQFVAQFMSETLRGHDPLAAFLTIAVILPVAEEFLFRGLILQGFLSRYSPPMSIAASALLFALMHGNPWQFLPGIIMGAFLAWCFVRTNSLIPCLFAHIANNSIAFMISRLQGRLPDLAKWITSYILWMDVAGVALAVMGIYLLKSFFDAHARIRIGTEICE